MERETKKGEKAMPRMRKGMLIHQQNA